MEIVYFHNVSLRFSLLRNVLHNERQNILSKKTLFKHALSYICSVGINIDIEVFGNLISNTHIQYCWRDNIRKISHDYCIDFLCQYFCWIPCYMINNIAPFWISFSYNRNIIFIFRLFYVQNIYLQLALTMESGTPTKDIFTFQISVIKAITVEIRKDHFFSAINLNKLKGLW